MTRRTKVQLTSRLTPDVAYDTLALDGGVPVRTEPWPTYDKGAVDVVRQDEEAALRAIRSHLYFRYDYRPHQETECGQFEAELCDYFGCRHALATSSGTTALALAWRQATQPRLTLAIFGDDEWDWF